MLESSRGSCRRPAFTLIELLVAIAIIAILIALLLPAEAKKQMEKAGDPANQGGGGGP